MEKQVKSKKRVADHGEVFTAEREVNAMLNIIHNGSCTVIWIYVFHLFSLYRRKWFT